MKLIKIGLANPDPTVGAFRSNVDKLVELATKMSRENCTIGCFSEQSIPGYPVEDLVLWGKFIEGQWEGLVRFAEETRRLNTIFVVGLAVEHESNAYNVAAVVCNGRILGLVPKEKLPTYGVFYEKRTYSAGIPGFVSRANDVPFGDLIFQFPFGKMAVEVCEDIWSPDGPMRRRAYSGAETIINISASPYRAGVLGTRRELISTRASDNVATVVYVNQVGGNDGLAFDGGGFVNQCGRMLLEARRWDEGFSTQVVDVDRTSRQRRENTTWRSDREIFFRNEKPTEVITPEKLIIQMSSGYKYPVPANKSFFIPTATTGPNPQEEYFYDLVQAMLMGLDGYFRKTGAFDRIGIAMSGGKDSALTLLVAHLYATKRLEKTGKELSDFIRCFSMPTRFNSSETRSIGHDLCEALGVSFTELSIADEFEQAVTDVTTMLVSGEKLTSLCLQNVQARIRGKRMWDWSNATRGMWLQTGNMSEKAVGYTTIGGDMMGAYSLLGNLPKTVVIELIKYLNRTVFNLEPLDRLIASTASAELAEDQADERDLMPFPVLDACYALFAGEKMAAEEVSYVLYCMFPEYEEDQLTEWVNRFVKLFQISIFKWVQAPESVHLGSLDLDRERALQLPVVQSAEWLEKSPDPTSVSS